jgi:hypothetical protein
MAVTVDYHMTLNSPWTYLGSALFAEIARRNDVTVNIKPCKHARTAAARGGHRGHQPRRPPELSNRYDGCARLLFGWRWLDISPKCASQSSLASAASAAAWLWSLNI